MANGGKIKRGPTAYCENLTQRNPCNEQNKMPKANVFNN